MLNKFNNWILNNMYNQANSKITANIHPLPVTQNQLKMENIMSGALAGYLLSLGFSFITVGVIFQIVDEKNKKIKHQHYIAGLSFVQYWMGNYIGNTFFFLFFFFLPLCVLRVCVCVCVCV